jgi:cold shock CspA family protein
MISPTKTTSANAAKRHIGQIKHWVRDKGFGFATYRQGMDMFVHIGACPPGYIPKVGDLVSYSVVSSSDGKLRASNVELVE